MFLVDDPRRMHVYRMVNEGVLRAFVFGILIPVESWLDLKLGVSGFGYCKIFFFLFFCNYDRIARLESRVRV